MAIPGPLPEYTALLAARHEAHRPELTGLLRELWGGQTLRVLDLACGDGFYSVAFDEVLGPGSEIVAADVSPAFLQLAAARANEERGPDHRIRFALADAERLPFPDGPFDLAWCAQSLISLPDPPAALRELRRVVKPGGTVAVLENDRLHEMQLPLPVPLELALRRAERNADGSDDSPYAGRFLERLFREAGLTPGLRRTLAIDRQSPLAAADRAFVALYLHTLLERTGGTLGSERRETLRRLADPDSPECLVARPDFWMTWTDVLVTAVRRIRDR